ncbi:MAG: AAA family ATPase [Aureispira sp.]
MQQSTALALLKAGKNVFLTGSAGSGKTYVLQQYINYLKKRRVALAVTASTGIAATHIKGMTIHAWSGIGLRQKISTEELIAMKSKKYLREQIERVNVLIVDEISMLHRQQLELVDQVLKYFKDNQYPFGGIQVIFSGDFFQLPPVGFPGEAKRDKFAFMSPSWVQAKLNICYLTEQHRQEVGALQHILNDIRRGQISPDNRALLEQAQYNEFAVDAIPPTLYSHNHDVNRTNNAHLRALEGKTFTFEATVKGNKRLGDMLKKAVQADETLYLKKTAKVIFVKNNPEQHYMNGTLGEVLDFDEKGLPIVQLGDGSQLVVEPIDWTIEDDTGKVLASYKQLPLRLAWAITVHKSQGMTLERAKADLRRCFEKGQGYVALSRLQSLKGLQLVGFNALALQVDALALKADHRFQELSKEIDQQINEERLKALEKRALVFLRHCGGITDPEAIERYNKKLKERKKQKKVPTHLITKDLVEEGKSLEEIAHARGLKTGTIINHLDKLHGLFPTFDFSAYRPDEQLLKDIKNSKDHLLKQDPSILRPDGTISSKLLHDEMGGKVDYTTIKLALLFI